jgi:hypothetical protein
MCKRCARLVFLQKKSGQSANKKYICHDDFLFFIENCSKGRHAVKKTLISCNSDSREQQIRKFLNELELGDRKPSELLREMKTLAGDHVDEPMLQTLWLHRLPLNVPASDGVPLEKMANIADKLVEIVSNRGSPSIAAITNQPAAPSQTTVAESLKSLRSRLRPETVKDLRRFLGIVSFYRLSSSVTRVPKKLKKERQNVHPQTQRVRS